VLTTALTILAVLAGLWLALQVLPVLLAMVIAGAGLVVAALATVVTAPFAWWERRRTRRRLFGV
jgi:uncharacterized membrane protein